MNTAAELEMTGDHAVSNQSFIPAGSRRYHLLYLFGQKAQTITICILVGVFVAGLGYSVYLGDALRYPDEQMYYAFAQNVSRHLGFSLDGLTPSAAKSPGYSFLLSVVMLISDSLLMARSFGYLTLCVSLWLVFVLVRRHSTAAFGLLGVILGVAYPVLFYTASTLFPQLVGAVLFLTIVFLADREQKLTIKTCIAVGVVSGYLVLTIPTFLFLLPVAFAWILVTRRSRLGLVVILACMVLVGLPWTVRNYHVFGSFVFVTTDGGINLLVGNNENTTPNAGINVDISKYTSLVVQRKMGPVEANRFYGETARKWILDHKTDAARLYVRKFINHFNFRNNLRMVAESSPLRDAVAGITYLPLLAVFLARLVGIRVFRPTAFEWLLIALYISWGVISAVFFTRVRYRLPLDFVLIAADALFIHRLVMRFGVGFQ